MRWILIVCVFAGVALLPSWSSAVPGDFPWQAQPLTTRHVATNGHDTTGNGTMLAPFRTISRAAQAAQPGTEILLLPGHYAGGTYLENLHGNATNPIWIRGADPTNRAMLSGGIEGLHLTKPRYVMLQHLEIAGASANGINSDDGSEVDNPNAAGFLVISNVLVRDIGGNGNQDGIKLSGLRDVYLFDVEATRCGGAASGSGVDLVGCHRVLIARGSFHNLSANAIQVKGGSSDIEIRQCIISNAGHRGINIGGSTGFEFFRPPLVTNGPNVEAHSVRVFANVFIGGTATVAFAGSTNCTVAHNTIIEPTRWVFRILQETVTSGGFTLAPCGANDFHNNIVYYRQAILNRYVNEGANTAPASFAVRNNLWFAFDQPTAAPYTLPGAVAGNRFGLDPHFAHPADQDYRITLASPAATNGWPGIGTAHDVAGIPYLLPSSIGAWEISGDTDGDTLPDYWEMAAFTTLVHGVLSDPDLDGMNNGEEHIADTHPLDPYSRLAFTAMTLSNGTPVIHWQGGERAMQWIETADEPPGTTWSTLAVFSPPTLRTNLLPMPVGAATMLRVRAGPAPPVGIGVKTP